MHFNKLPQLQERIDWPFLIRVSLRTILFFLIVNQVFGWLSLFDNIAGVSVHNTMLPGRHRLPYGESQESFNLTTSSLAMMIASHEVSASPDEDEFRVFVLGDSSVWGTLLSAQESTVARMGQYNVRTPDGRAVRFYNLGYPTMSVLKDLLILESVRQLEPDLVIWFTTQRSLENDNVWEAPILQDHLLILKRIVQEEQLASPSDEAAHMALTQEDGTIIGKRRVLNEWFRLQLYGIMWWATGVDSVADVEYSQVSNDIALGEDLTSRFDCGADAQNSIRTDILQAGQERYGSIPFLIVNEPIFTANGDNSDFYYNTWYSKAGYNCYRRELSTATQESGWWYIDLWDRIAPDHFTDSPVHLSANGAEQLAGIVIDKLLELGFELEKTPGE
jgi:hypothetical protein